MGGKGPPRTPTQVLKARGSWLAKERAKSEPPAPTGEPERETWIKGPARKAWNVLGKLLDAMGMQSPIDGIALQRYCVLWEEWQKCAKVIRKEGALTPVCDKAGNTTYVDRPEVARLLKIGDQMLRLEKEFGMTPAARAALAGRVKDKNASAPKTSAAGFFGKASGA